MGSYCYTVIKYVDSNIRTDQTTSGAGIIIPSGIFAYHNLTRHTYISYVYPLMGIRYFLNKSKNSFFSSPTGNRNRNLLLRRKTLYPLSYGAWLLSVHIRYKTGLAKHPFPAFMSVRYFLYVLPQISDR